MADVPAIRITAIDDASRVLNQITGSLAGLAASVVSINSVMQTFKAALNFGDQLQTTNEKLGISVAKLQELSAIAVQSNTSLEAFGKSFKFLAESMVKAQTLTSEQGKLFRALGVSVQDSQGNLRALDEVLPDVAESLNRIGNETVRTAAGVSIFGKGYLEVAAALRTYKTAQDEANRIIEVFGTVTSTAAQSADQLGDKMKLLGEGFKATTLNEMSRGFASLSAAIDGSTKSVADFARFIGRGFALDMRDGAVLVTRFQEAFDRLGVMATAVWEAIRTRSREPLRQMGKDLEAIIQKYEAARGAIRSSFGFPGLDNEDQVSRATGAKDRVKQAQIDAAAVAAALGGKGGAVRDVTKELEAMVKAQESALASEMKLSEVDKLYIALSAMKLGTLKGVDLELVKRLTQDAQLRDDAKATADAIKDENEHLKAQADEFRRENDAMAELAKSYQERIKASDKIIEDIEFETKLLGMNNVEREVAIGLRAQEATGIKLSADQLEVYTDRLRTAVQAKEGMQQQVDLWKRIGDAGYDAWMHIFEGGKSVIDRLMGALKQMLLELAWMAAKKWVLNIGIAGSAAGAAGAAGAEGLGGNLAGGFLTSGLGGWLSGLADSSGLTAGMGNLGLSLGFSGETAMWMAANAVPIVGTILAVGGGLIYNWLESKKGGPKTGGFATSGTIGALGGYTDSSGRWITPSDADAKMKEYTEATLKNYQTFAKSLGMKAIAGFAQGFTSDPQGTAGNILHTQAWVNGKSVYEVALGDLGRDAQVLADRIALENKRALIAALKASDLPGILSQLFANVVPETITSDAADSLLTFAVAYKDLYDVFNANPMDDALDAVAEAARGAQAAVEKQGEALLDLLDTYDGTGEATTNLSTATKSYYANVVALIAQMEQLKTTIKDMFASSIKTYAFAKLDKSGQYAYLQAEAASLTAQLATATDATTIDKLTKQIDADMREAFGLLSPEQQAAQADKFIQGANNVNAIAQQQLTAAQNKASEKLDSILTAIKTTIDAAAEKFSGAAELVAQGGEDIIDAADTLSGSPGTRQPLVTG